MSVTLITIESKGPAVKKLFGDLLHGSVSTWCFYVIKATTVKSFYRHLLHEFSSLCLSLPLDILLLSAWRCVFSTKHKTLSGHYKHHGNSVGMWKFRIFSIQQLTLNWGLCTPRRTTSPHIWRSLIIQSSIEQETVFWLKIQFRVWAKKF